MARGEIVLKRAKSVADEVEELRGRIRQQAYMLFRTNGQTDPVDNSAEFKDGVLKVHLPTSPNAKPKSIEVKVS